MNLVLVPLTVTDPLNRLVTGLDKENFFLFENNHPQTIRTFSSEDAPVSIGVIMDLSGSMTNKVIRSRESILQFMKTANPQDEFFVIGFNDRPELIEDFTSSVDDIEARLEMVKAGHRTALLDAIYFGLEKMKQAKYPTQGTAGGFRWRRQSQPIYRKRGPGGGAGVRRTDLFDRHLRSNTRRPPKRDWGRCCSTISARRRVAGCSGWTTSPIWPTSRTKISAELRNEYVLGYKPVDEKRDGKWRKLKVKLVPRRGCRR